MYSKTSEEAALCLNKTGELQRKVGRDAKALKSFQSAVEILEQLRGEHSALLVIPLYNLGVAYHADQKYAEGRASYERSLAIDLKEHGEMRLETANIHDSLGVLLSEQVKILCLFVCWSNGYLSNSAAGCWVWCRACMRKHCRISNKLCRYIARYTVIITARWLLR